RFRGRRVGGRRETPCRGPGRLALLATGVLGGFAWFASAGQGPDSPPPAIVLPALPDPVPPVAPPAAPVAPSSAPVTPSVVFPDGGFPLSPAASARPVPATPAQPGAGAAPQFPRAGHG